MTAAKLCVPCGKPNRPQARFCGCCGKPFEPPFLKKAIESSGSLTPPSASLQNKEHQLRRTNARVSIRQLRNAIALLIIISGLLGLFTYTNPTLEQYGDFIQQHVILQSKTPQEPIGASLFTAPLIAGGLRLMTERDNYYLFSVYETKLEEIGRWKAIGILNNFIVVESPRSS